MKRLTLAAVFGAAVLAATAAATQQDEWVRQVRAQLTAAGREFAARGFTLTHRVWTGSLADGGSETVEVQLEAGREYHFMGVCDEDCTDLDLQLTSPSGSVLDTDVEPDDFPIVSGRATRTGTYRVEVLMASCSAEPCRYGIGVYGKQ